MSAGAEHPAQRLNDLAHKIYRVTKRVIVGCFNDGTIHAGNLAYMSILAIFPFFITGAAIFSVIGEEADRAAAINAFVAALPPLVSEVIEPVARNVVQNRSGWLLWLGGLVGLWTVSGLIETIRDILRRSYGTTASRAFWMYRLASAGMIIGAVFVLLLSLMAQVAISAAQEVILAYFPELEATFKGLGWSKIVTGAGLFISIYALFLALTPGPYRARQYPKWPGAALVAVWWVSVATALPPIMRSLVNSNMTYGSLAGIIVVLFFFWLVGLGLVAGAELNAALAERIADGNNGKREPNAGEDFDAAVAEEEKQG